MITWEDIREEIVVELKEKAQAADAVYDFETDEEVLSKLQGLTERQREYFDGLRSSRKEDDGILSQKELDLIAINTVLKNEIRK